MRGVFGVLMLLVLMFILVMSALGLPLAILYPFLVFIGSEKRASRILLKLQSMLMDGEVVISGAIEVRSMSLFQRRAAVFLTNSRMIFIHRRIFGGYKMTDRQWKDLKDVEMDENIFPGFFGASLKFSFYNPPGGTMYIWGVRSDEAAVIYKHAQAQEQAWEEKRRVRNLEETRARSGGINFHGLAPVTPVAAAPNEAPSSVTSRVGAEGTVAAEMKTAKDLLDNGLISDAEFQEIKSKILSKHF